MIRYIVKKGYKYLHKMSGYVISGNHPCQHRYGNLKIGDVRIFLERGIDKP